MPSDPSHPRPRPRSRSPHRPRDDHRPRKTTRSRSPLRHSHSTRDRHSHRDSKDHHHHHRDSKDRHHRRPHDSKPPRGDPKPAVPAVLPSNARHLSRADLPAFEPLFAHYLDLQKGIPIATLSDSELKGRWKSFVGKWNRAELAAGWYDPETYERVRGEYIPTPRAAPTPASAPEPAVAEEDEEEEDDYGPSLPSTRSGGAAGPAIPTPSDLTLRAEQLVAERSSAFADLRAARKDDRRQQKERLDELVPRAEAGTRERMLEKRKEVGEKMRAFRERSPGGGDEVGDDELVGEGGGLAEAKRLLEREKVKVSERQLRREAVAREIAAEREERVQAYREREEETMGKLRELARRRFG